MAFAAAVPAVTSGAAAGTAAAGARVAAVRGSTARAGATGTAKPVAAPALPRGTAAGRAGELVAGGTPRYKARRALMDEFGATGGQADDLLDAAGQNAEPPAVDDPNPDQGHEPAQRSSSAGRPAPRLPRPVSGAFGAGGGLLLGALSYTLALVFLRDGTDGLRRWFAAKFLNRVPTAPAGKSKTAGQVQAPPTTGALLVRSGVGAS